MPQSCRLRKNWPHQPDVIVPLVRVFGALGELEPEQVLVDLEKPLSDFLQWKELPQSLLVHRVGFLLNHGGVVGQVPIVEDPVEVQTQLLTLKWVEF